MSCPSLAGAAPLQSPRNLTYQPSPVRRPDLTAAGVEREITPVDRQQMASDEGGGVRRQEDGSLGHVLRLAEAVERNAHQHPVAGLLRVQLRARENTLERRGHDLGGL